MTFQNSITHMAYSTQSPHKQITVYTDSAPNSFSKLQTIRYPTLLDNLELSSNFETISESILNFEVSETETCDSIQSDNFQLFPESPLNESGYQPKLSTSTTAYNVNLNNHDPSLFDSSNDVHHGDVSADYLIGNSFVSDTNDNISVVGDGQQLDSTVSELALLYEIYPSQSYQPITNETDNSVNLIHPSLTELSDKNLSISDPFSHACTSRVQIHTNANQQLSAYPQTTHHQIPDIPSDIGHHSQASTITSTVRYNHSRTAIADSNQIDIAHWIEPENNSGGCVHIPLLGERVYPDSISDCERRVNLQQTQHQQHYVHETIPDSDWNSYQEQNIIFPNYIPFYPEDQHQDLIMTTNETGYLVSHVPVEHDPTFGEPIETTVNYYYYDHPTDMMTIPTQSVPEYHASANANVTTDPFSTSIDRASEFSSDLVRYSQNYWIQVDENQVQHHHKHPQQYHDYQKYSQQLQQVPEHREEHHHQQFLTQPKAPPVNSIAATSTNPCVQEVDMDIFGYGSDINHPNPTEMLQNAPCINVVQTTLNQAPASGNTISYAEDAAQHSDVIDPYCNFVPKFEENLTATHASSQFHLSSPKSNLDPTIINSTCDGKAMSKLCCPHCPRTFIRSAHLQDHLRVHTGERPHWCVLCGRQFSQASNLSRHLKSHKVWPGRKAPTEVIIPNSKPMLKSGETLMGTQYTLSDDPATNILPKRQWFCRFCNQHFTTYLQLRAHLVHHKDKQVYACLFDGCDSTYNNPNAFLIHLVDKHRISTQNNFECHVCRTNFTDFTQLIRHWLPRRSGTHPGCPSLSKRRRRKPTTIAPKPPFINLTPEPPKPYTSGKHESIPKIRLLPLEGLGKLDHRSRLRCPFCRKTCLRLRHLRAHLAKCHADLLSSNKLTNFPATTSLLDNQTGVSQSSDSCSSTKTALILVEVEKSQSKEDQMVSSSAESTTSLSTNQSLNRQTREVSNKVGLLTCKLCGKVFQRRKPFEDHEIMCQRATNTINSRLPLLSVKVGQALQFDILAECSTTRARSCQLWLPHCPNGPVETPVFMPVGTQGAMKGVTVSQLEKLDCRILLGNTYHLGHRPGPEALQKAGGLHKFMAWPRAILTDSGGFQMVSLDSLSEVTEDGVHFTSPHNKTQMLLTPEESVGHLQHVLGSDIVMQLDHVVHVLTDDKAMEDAMHRSIRWLDRSIEAHKIQEDKQNLFAITQGGLNDTMRKYCIGEMIKRKDKLPGFAIGGLSGGEAKDAFCRTILLSTGQLPRDRPRYVMGVGFPVDLVVCIALGCDMFDCVYPTRTGRFGHALVPWGQLNLRQAKYATDFGPIDESCPCPGCQRPLSRSWIHSALSGRQVNATSVVSLHNLYYMLNLMRQCREAIRADNYPQFVRQFFQQRCYTALEDQDPTEYEFSKPPQWVVDALDKVGIDMSGIGLPQEILDQKTNGNSKPKKFKSSVKQDGDKCDITENCT